ncbi:MAG: phosphoribosylformylglycinamidine synthase [Lentisphaeria bacterium]|nr:phosphoribosylformylglycinamidine synthase [Lentisphaeria bacterium]
MIHRIEIATLARWRDSRAESVKAQIRDFLKIEVNAIRTRDVYTVDADVDAAQAVKIAELLYNPVLQSWRTGDACSANCEADAPCDFLIAVGFRPGVTDNVGRSAKSAVGDILARPLRDDEAVYSSVEYMLSGDLSGEQVETIARKLLANELIQSVRILKGSELVQGVPVNRPVISGVTGGNVRTFDLAVSDDALMELSRERTLALTLEEMKVIQEYFRTAGDRAAYGLSAQPTDVELEVLAQTWSEHCKHKIFSATIDYQDLETGASITVDSCYKSFIKKSTREIAEEVDFLVSVFSDNAGVITFNDQVDICYKVETHNSPSALDPYGGAMTGIVGVNRDPMGTGQGADLLINVWGYCLGSPFTADEDVPEGLLHPRRIRDGVHKGVIDGGNQSGIPYGNGWEYFDERYIGKPLIYCGTVGTLPRQIGDVKGFEKSIKPGDLIVMGGGRIGKDGIHGATFSSEELHQDSPVQAVQIGDPITQKKLGDFIHEARQRGLYRFITDNGAGGLSSSVGEMSELCNGCRLELGAAPLKYSGLDPWEILVSEAQERMSFAVPPEKKEEFLALAAARDVEVSILGEFTDDGFFHVLYNGKTVARLSIEFMHSGLPKMHLKAAWRAPQFEEPVITTDVAADLVAMVGRLNICSDEYKARQYDHEVKGLSVIKPFIGKCRDVASDATVTMIGPLATEGVVLSSGILPRYSDIDTYWMAASVLDLAIRRIIAVGGSLGHIAGLDNFCWPDPVQSAKTPDGEYKLAQLVRANQGLYDFTKKFRVPLISGKDSMKNDSTRGGRKISIPPTVLLSAISKMDDVSKALTLDFKRPGEVIYVIGETLDELGGSEYYAMFNAIGSNVPRVDADKALQIYQAVSEATRAELVTALHTPALGGLGVAFAKMAVAGRLGAKLDLRAIQNGLTVRKLLFSESNSRFVATVRESDAAAFEAKLAGVPFARVGVVTGEPVLAWTAEDDGAVVEASIGVDALVKSYKTTLDHI